MKKVIRLTESDLTRIVMRVIKEQQSSTSTAQQAVSLIEKGMSGMGTDENMVAKGVYMIKKDNYNEVLRLIKQKGNYKTVMDWISTDWTYVDKGSDFGGFNSKTNTQLQDLVRHLQQFNPNESYRKSTVTGNSPGRTSNDGTFKPRN